MTRKIYKYVIDKVAHQVEISMPVGAEILSAQNQDNKITLWAIIDSEIHLTEVRKFRIFGTSHPLTEDCGIENHLATIQIEGFVWHVFEIK